jgi:hypothetical protein
VVQGHASRQRAQGQRLCAVAAPGEKVDAGFSQTGATTQILDRKAIEIDRHPI